MIKAAFFSPIPLSCSSSSAEAVLILIFGSSSAPATAMHARITTITVTHEIRDRRFRLSDLLCNEGVKERATNKNKPATRIAQVAGFPESHVMGHCPLIERLFDP
jgi:hypothetical protein